MTIQCMGDAGENIFGMSAVDFYKIKDDYQMIRELADKQIWRTYHMKIRANFDQN